MTAPAEGLGPGAVRARGRTAALAVAAAGGAGTMLVELSAVRLISPWFGTSLVVWTNVIGVVLLSLAVGYLVGARLAAGARPRASLALVLAAAAAAAAWTPALAGPVCELFMPRGVALHEAARLLAWGSLASSLCLFLPPALFLGCVAPLCVEVHQRAAPGHAGTSGGLVLAASTLGSLAGTFGTSLWLVPGIGVTATFLTGAAVLGAAALTALVAARSSRAVAAPALLAAAALAFPLADVARPAPGGGRLVEERESRYQTVRVVAEERGEPHLRYLQVNELTDSYQSVWQPEPGLLPEGFYYNAFALPPWWSGVRGGSWRVLVLGLGAGTAWRVLEGTLPEDVRLEAAGVEIDPVVVELARRHMDLASGEDRNVIAGLDARAFLGAAPPREWDQIVLDAYANQVEIPAHLSTVEFFDELEARLAPGGWLSVNVGSFALDDPVLVAIAETMAAAFEAPSLAVRVPKARNHVVFARRSAPLPRPGTPAWRVPGALGDWLAPLELPGSVSFFEPPARAPLIDDRSDVERLQRESLEHARALRGSLR